MLQTSASLHCNSLLLLCVCARFAGLRFINLMGSHGVKAVAAALMGASATCVDISPSNAQYGQQLAAAAGVDVRFVVSDVLQLPESEHAGERHCIWQQQLAEECGPARVL
jgi:23S rRNA G2069 N7-methylase RlmK/C1962 C5-methylase RlmI